MNCQELAETSFWIDKRSKPLPDVLLYAPFRADATPHKLSHIPACAVLLFQLEKVKMAVFARHIAQKKKMWEKSALRKISERGDDKILRSGFFRTL